ncbi:MAG: phosphoribosyltransferase [Acidimicrobiales bacterium]
MTPAARVVHTRAEVDAALKRLGRELQAAYPKGALLVAVQKGSILVLADLVRRIDAPCRVDFLAISDYAGGSGRARIVQDLETDVHDCDVVLVEDIVDTGLTCAYVLETLRGRGPRSLAVCALLDRRSRRIVPVPLRFVGFEATDELLIGRGLGVSGRYRNLDLVAAADSAILQSDRDAYVSQLYTPRIERPVRTRFEHEVRGERPPTR